MVRKRNTRPRKRTLATRFKKEPINTITAEAKKLGVPKPVTKLAILGIAAGLLTPKLGLELNRIPFMSIFTGYGAELKRSLSLMKNKG